jgi:hypothetical protein
MREYKICLRYCDENINSRQEHLEKMRYWTRKEPVWIKGEGEDLEFSYAPILGEDGTRIQQTNPYRPFFNNVESTSESGYKGYGIELVLIWTIGESSPVSIHPRDYQRAVSEICNATDCDEHFSLLVYDWDAEGEEPIEW